MLIFYIYGHRYQCDSLACVYFMYANMENLTCYFVTKALYFVGGVLKIKC